MSELWLVQRLLVNCVYWQNVKDENADVSSSFFSQTSKKGRQDLEVASCSQSSIFLFNQK